MKSKASSEKEIPVFDKVKNSIKNQDMDDFMSFFGDRNKDRMAIVKINELSEFIKNEGYGDWQAMLRKSPVCPPFAQCLNEIVNAAILADIQNIHLTDKTAGFEESYEKLNARDKAIICRSIDSPRDFFEIAKKYPCMKYETWLPMYIIENSIDIGIILKNGYIVQMMDDLKSDKGKTGGINLSNNAVRLISKKIKADFLGTPEFQRNLFIFLDLMSEQSKALILNRVLSESKKADDSLSLMKKINQENLTIELLWGVLSVKRAPKEEWYENKRLEEEVIKLMNKVSTENLKEIMSRGTNYSFYFRKSSAIADLFRKNKEIWAVVGQEMEANNRAPRDLGINTFCSSFIAFEINKIFFDEAENENGRAMAINKIGERLHEMVTAFALKKEDIVTVALKSVEDLSTANSEQEKTRLILDSLSEAFSTELLIEVKNSFIKQRESYRRVSVSPKFKGLFVDIEEKQRLVDEITASQKDDKNKGIKKPRYLI